MQCTQTDVISEAMLYAMLYTARDPQPAAHRCSVLTPCGLRDLWGPHHSSHTCSSPWGSCCRWPWMSRARSSARAREAGLAPRSSRSCMCCPAHQARAGAEVRNSLRWESGLTGGEAGQEAEPHLVGRAVQHFARDAVRATVVCGAGKVQEQSMKCPPCLNALCV